MAVCLAGNSLLAADEPSAAVSRERLGMWALVLVAGAAGIVIGWLAGRSGPVARRVTGFKVPLIRVNASGQVIKWNGAAERLAAESGLPDVRALAPENAAEIAKACIAGTGPANHEWAAGNRWISGTLEPLDGRDGIQMLLSDVTERHQLEEEMSKVREESASNAKLTSEFVSNISHDIRVPMSGVIGLGKLLLETDLTPEQHELSRTLVESAENAVTLADELLDLAKIEAGKLEIDTRPMEIASLVEDTLRSQSARAAEKHIDLFCDVDPGLPGMIQGDPVRVRQVLANLVSNGLKFTQRGEIVVTVRAESNDSGGGHDLRFAVRDTGIGIPEEKRDRLFKAFNQADSSTYKLHGGTGLGLVTSRQLAELMGGRMWFESEPNRGSTFFFNIPLVPVANSVPPGWTLEQPLFAGWTALIVEDNPRLLNVISDLMLRWGVNAVAFRSTTEAISWLERKEVPNVAIIDLDMPELAAFHILRKLASLPSKPRLLGMAFEPQARSRSSVPIELLLKPVCPSTLLDHLRRPPSRISATASSKESPAAERATEPSDSPAARKLNVLVADDDPVNRRVVRNYLERLGCAVTTVSDGSEAFQRFEPGRFDIIFLDIMMPGMDGFAVTRAIRNRELDSPGASAKRQPLVALTAKAMAGDAENSIAAGFDAHLTKPVSEQQFRETLEKHAGYSPERPAPMRMPRLATLQAPEDGIIDRSRLSELGSGDPAAIADIARMYFERIAKLAPEITSALVAARADDAKRHAHTGAGSSSTAGMIAASKAFRALEEAIGRGELASADKLLADALGAVEQCRKAMQPLLKAVPQTGEGIRS